jgi:hypothetical protein
MELHRVLFLHPQTIDHLRSKHGSRTSTQLKHRYTDSYLSQYLPPSFASEADTPPSKSQETTSMTRRLAALAYTAPMAKRSNRERQSKL